MKIIKAKFDKDIKKKIKELDDTFNSYETVDISWYDRYSDDSDIYLLVDNNLIVGYVCACPITKELYNQFINGQISNDYEIDSKHFLKKSDYYYIPSILIKDSYRNKGYGQKLVKLLYDDINNKKIVALSITKEGFKLCQKYLTLIKKLDNEKYIFIN